MTYDIQERIKDLATKTSIDRIIVTYHKVNDNWSASTNSGGSTLDGPCYGNSMESALELLIASLVKKAINSRDIAKKQVANAEEVIKLELIPSNTAEIVV